MGWRSCVDPSRLLHNKSELPMRKTSLLITLLTVLFLTMPAHAEKDMSTMDHSGHDMTKSMKMESDETVEHMEGHADHAMEKGSEAMEDHSGHDMGDGEMEHDHQAMMEENAKSENPVAITERLDSVIPSAIFTNSKGETVDIADLFDVPTVILPIYFKCPDVCNFIQGSFASILPQVKLEGGSEIQVISLSFDPRDKTRDAARSKKTYMQAMGPGFPPEHWHFLTGDQKNIDIVLDAMGYSVERQGGLYAHPVAIVVVAPGGKVSRYLYGSTFLPFDVTMAATEAAKGLSGMSVKRLLSVCYSYDPEGRRYVFNTLRVAGFSIMGFIAIFVAYLLLGNRKGRQD